MRLTRHRGKWALIVGGVRSSTGFEATRANRNAAERKAREIIAKDIKDTSGQSCGAIMTAWLEDMPMRASPKTPTNGTLCAVKAVSKFFGLHHPEDVTRDECRAYIEQRRNEGRSDGTIRKELGSLGSALRWKDKETPAQIELPPSPPPRNRWLTKDELKRLLTASKNSPHITTFIHLAIATGGRKEAILQLRWDTHIDFENKRIWLGFKAGGKKRALVPMTDKVYNILKEADEIGLGDYVIEWGGEQIKDVKKALKQAYKRAKIESITAPAHVLRHTAGAYMAMDGVAMLEISRRLGHSSITTTEKVYAHFSPDNMKASTEALEI